MSSEQNCGIILCGVRFQTAPLNSAVAGRSFIQPSEIEQRREK